MKRVIFIEDGYGGKSKYVLVKEYDCFGIYQRKCPTGFFVSQDYLVVEDCYPYEQARLIVLSQSYNGLCIEELLDMIDCYAEMGKLYQKTIDKYDAVLQQSIKVIHPNGKES